MDIFSCIAHEARNISKTNINTHTEEYMDNSYLLFFISALLCAANAFAEYDYKKDLKENCSSLSARIRPQNLNSSIIYQIQWRAFTNKGDIKSARRLIPHLSELGVDYL